MGREWDSEVQIEGIPKGCDRSILYLYAKGLWTVLNRRVLNTTLRSNTYSYSWEGKNPEGVFSHI